MPTNAVAQTAEGQERRPPESSPTLPILWPEDQHGRDTSVQWVVRDLLRRGAVGTVFGLPGTFKSFLVSDAALSVANGRDEFLGLTIEASGPALIISADDGADTTIDRLRSIATFRLGNSSYDNIAVADRGHFSLQDRDAERQLRTALFACLWKFRARPVLVVIDTAAMAGAPTEDFGHTYPERLGWLKGVASTFGCAIILVDHESKPQRDRPILDVRSGGWGSVMKAGFFEFAWSLRRVGDNGSQILLRAKDKRSPHEPRAQLEFWREGGSYSVHVVKTATVDGAIEEGLAQKGPQTIDQLADATGKSRDTVARAINRLIEKGPLIKARRHRGQNPALYALFNGSAVDVDDLPP